jgi:hypothetical protein
VAVRFAPLFDISGGVFDWMFKYVVVFLWMGLFTLRFVEIFGTIEVWTYNLYVPSLLLLGLICKIENKDNISGV